MDSNKQAGTQPDLFDVGTGESQVVGADGIEDGQTVQVIDGQQSEADRENAITTSMADAKKLIDESGANGFLLVALNGDDTANSLLAGDYATIVHATHTAVCALGGVTKEVQSKRPTGANAAASADDFTAGASILAMHHAMLRKMAGEQAASAAADAALAAAATKQ